MRQKKYMHTIKGQPAFYDGDQICYAVKVNRFENFLANSLTEIRNQQKLSIIWRKVQGLSDSSDQYGYIMFYVD